jgi:hypothetical protein
MYDLEDNIVLDPYHVQTKTYPNNYNRCYGSRGNTIKNLDTHKKDSTS